MIVKVTYQQACDKVNIHQEIKTYTIKLSTSSVYNRLHLRGLFNPISGIPALVDGTGENADCYIVEFPIVNEVTTKIFNFGSQDFNLKNGSLVVYYQSSQKWKVVDGVSNYNFPILETVEDALEWLEQNGVFEE